VQGQVQHVPASHKQLLGLFGVSPQAAVWVAALMASASCGGRAPTFGQCIFWNPHLLELGQRYPPEKLQALAATLQPQLQRWSDTPLLALLHSVLLYGATYATPVQDPEEWAWNCMIVTAGLIALTEARCSAAADAGSSSSSSSTDNVDPPPLPDTVRDEMLLLILNLLPRVQQLRGSGADAGSSRSSSSRSMAASTAAATA
jgi:hypothetical protein